MALTKEDLLAISQLLDAKLKTELQPIKEDIISMKKDIISMKADIASTKEDVISMKADIASTKEDIIAMKADIASTKEDIIAMKADICDLQQKVSDISVHLENVTDKNIKIIAEGHTDLARKLDEALKVENEKELLLIRMSYLEDEVRKIKERLAQIA